MLDPQAQALMQLMADRGMPPVYTQTPEQARASYRERRGFSQPAPAEVARVQDMSFSHAGVRIAVRVYHPTLQGLSSGAAPALLYLHGGGWTVGDLDTHDVLCRSLCREAQGVVVALDYRMGPEHKFPAAYEEAVAAYQWLLTQAVALGLDPQKIAIGGDSAGGNLAAAACLGLRDVGLTPAFQLLIYPSTMMQPTTQSYQDNGQGYMLTKESMAWYAGNYLRSSEDAQDWRASPQLASSHANLPAALVLTAGFDPLRDEGLMYADALSQAGVPAQYICFERQIHGFITMGRVIQEANTAVALCVHALRTAWGLSV